MNKMRAAILASALAAAQLSDDSCRQSFAFGADFPGFGGHFPGYPILPGVLQVLLGQLLAERITGSPLPQPLLERAKFMRQLRPEDRIDVQAELTRGGEQLRCKVRLEVGGELASQFVLKYKEDGVSV